MARRPLVVNLALLAVIGLIVFLRLDAIPFHVDESCKIAYSAPFEAFAAGRFDDPIWQSREDKYLNPVLTYYVIGAARRIGGYDAARLNAPWDFRQTDADNVRLGRVPEPALLWWSRAGVTAAAGAGLFGLFLLLTRATARWAAYVWLACALASPYLRTSLRQALNEGVLIATVALTLWALERTLEAFERRDAPLVNWPAVGWTAVAGAGAGLSAQTKLTGGTVALGVWMVLLLASVRKPGGLGARAPAVALVTLALAVSAAGTFIGTNPSLWPDPLRDAARMVRARVEIIAAQVVEQPDDAIGGVLERLARVPPRVLHPDVPLPAGMALVVLFGVGCTLSARALARWLRGHGDCSRARIALTVAGLVAAAPGLFAPLDWSRYFVLPAIFASLQMAFGLEWAARAVLHSVGKTPWRR
jgi:hypothetical protein